LAYLHLIRPSATDEDAWREGESLPATRMLRKVYTGTMISAGGFTRDTAEEALQDGRADLIAFGQLFIANPDLVERFRIGAPLNEPDRATFYGGGEHGYIDYAALEALEA
jgi:N-ethylmaleimide reductase